MWSRQLTTRLRLGSARIGVEKDRSNNGPRFPKQAEQNVLRFDRGAPELSGLVPCEEERATS
jgi:hypothetical protein